MKHQEEIDRLFAETALRTAIEELKGAVYAVDRAIHYANEMKKGNNQELEVIGYDLTALTARAGEIYKEEFKK